MTWWKLLALSSSLRPKGKGADSDLFPKKPIKGFDLQNTKSERTYLKLSKKQAFSFLLQKVPYSEKKRTGPVTYKEKERKINHLEEKFTQVSSSSMERA